MKKINLTQLERTALNLSKDKSIIICKSTKGSFCVIQDRLDYISEKESGILSTTYQPIFSESVYIHRVTKTCKN